MPKEAFNNNNYKHTVAESFSHYGLDEKIQTGIKSDVISLKEPIIKMIEPVIGNIRAGDYQLLIGEDSSGRIPTLIVKKVIQEIYQEKKLEPIETRFIAGSKGVESTDKFSEIKEYLSELQNKIPELKGVLLVTDSIFTGNSLIPITQALSSEGLAFDILTVSVFYGEEDAPKKEHFLNGPIFAGSVGTTSIIGKDYNGVIKNPNDLHATKIDSANQKFQQHIDFAREVAREVATEILEHFKSHPDLASEK